MSCEAVGDKTYIMFDSGVRGASDVFKALALGAKFVFVGRLWVWGQVFPNSPPSHNFPSLNYPANLSLPASPSWANTAYATS